MPTITLVYGTDEIQIETSSGALLGDVIQASGMPIEQPCAGRGTCGKCKVIVESGEMPPDEIELLHLTPGELAINSRLACRARVLEDARIILSPIVVYSNKIFRTSTAYKRSDEPLGLAIDLGSTTVAAFLTGLHSRQVFAGGATLNQQASFGSDVISRIGAALQNPNNSDRLYRLAVASINQAVDSLKLSKDVTRRIERVIVVGNVAMHHLLSRLPMDTLGGIPFQPVEKKANKQAADLMGGIFPQGVQVMLPPLIGGFVGSDALACLAYFGFDQAASPMAAIDLGTNGEVMLTDGQRILTASTAAGPAFEGVNISCGSRAVDGAVVDCRIEGEEIIFTTIGEQTPLGLTGSGLLSLVNQLVKAGVIESSGRINASPASLTDRLVFNSNHTGAIRLDADGQLLLTQWDIRELQKAKGAVRAAIDTLLNQLGLEAQQLQRVILTGSFGGQVDIQAVTQLGMIPRLEADVVKTIANGAGLGAAMFLTDEGFSMAEHLAAKAEQIDLDQDSDFVQLYIKAMDFPVDPIIK